MIPLLTPVIFRETVPLTIEIVLFWNLKKIVRSFDFKIYANSRFKNSPSLCLVWINKDNKKIQLQSIFCEAGIRFFLNMIWKIYLWMFSWENSFWRQVIKKLRLSVTLTSAAQLLEICRGMVAWDYFATYRLLLMNSDYKCPCHKKRSNHAKWNF